MTKRDVVEKLLATVADRSARVARLARPTVQDLAADEDALDLVAFNLMLAVQAACDATAHIIADEQFQPAASLAEGFHRLAEQGVVSDHTATQLGRAVGLRNVVAHAYHRIDPAAVQRASTEGITDLDAFVREVATWLSSRPRTP
jgi:uncharacterized protein YutE (UPF0331/DUF86 family)